MVNTINVLLVEDNPGDARLVQEMFVDANFNNYELIQAEHLVEALKWLNESSFDILILDLELPDSQGLETFSKIHDLYPDVPIVVLSGLADELVAIEAVRKGAQDYLIKGSVNGNLLIRSLLYAIERKKMEKKIEGMIKELRTRNKKLEEAKKLKTEYISMVVHDIGTPLSVISGHTQLMKNGNYGELSEIQEKTMTKILNSVRNLNSIRMSILEISKFEHGKILLAKENVKIDEIIKSCVDEIEFLSTGKNQEVEMNSTETVVACDKKWIKQAISNYLSNAVRYTGEGGKISISSNIDDGFLVLSVKDNGRGIPEEDLEKIFAGFYRTGKKVEGSTGLGLAIVKKLIEAHGGNVWCESELGNGSTFYFTVPLIAEK
ncbi:MAG: ATP-binding protein [Candidatus Hodarchaeales archaeon]|jgi:signal transduction histidine kinase